MSLHEVVSLIASFKSVSEPKKNKLDKSRYTPEQLKALEEHIQKSSKQETVLDEFQFSKSFDEFPEFPNFGFYAQAFRLFDEHGQLPHSGTLDAQPNRTMEIINILSALRNEEQSKKNNNGK